MSSEVISFIGVTYDELSSMPLENLEKKIVQNIKSYLNNICQMNRDEKIDMRDKVKDTRKIKFRFSQELTQNIPKNRIQIALSQLAKLFRELDDDIKKTKDSKHIE